MAEKIFFKTIPAEAEAVFDLITQIGDYDRWLSSSSAFGTIRDISDDPIRAGTTYTDDGPQVAMQGTVLDYERPRTVTFQQTARMYLNSNLTITIRYDLEPVEQSTRVKRTYLLKMTGLLRVLQPLVMRSVTAENERILDVMRSYFSGIDEM